MQTFPRTYRIMATFRVDSELNRIAFEMLACEAAAVLEVETGALVVMQAGCGTVQT